MDGTMFYQPEEQSTTNQKKRYFHSISGQGPVIIMMMTLMLELPMHLHAFSWNKWNGEAILKKKTGSGLSQNVRNHDDKDLLQTFYVEGEYCFNMNLLICKLQ